MKKLLFYVFIITVLFFVSFLFPDVSKAVYIYSTDRVFLYENGKRINDDNAIFLVSYKKHSERCESGLCFIDQQFYPVTIYRTKNNDTLTYAEYREENYLKYLEENSYYSVSFNPGPSGGGEPAPPGGIGGRIGTYRRYALQIDNGIYMQISGEPTETFEENTEVAPFTKKSFWKNIILSSIIYLSIFIIVLAPIIYFIKNRKRDEYKDQK